MPLLSLLLVHKAVRSCHEFVQGAGTLRVVERYPHTQREIVRSCSGPVVSFKNVTETLDHDALVFFGTIDDKNGKFVSPDTANDV